MDDIKKKYAIDAELIKSGGGAFEVKVDDHLIFSKLKLDRFPEHQEIFEEIDALK